MLTIVFYFEQGKAAKVRAREICAQSKGDYARVYDVGVWDGTPDKCDNVEIMSDVPKWHRKRIMEVYGEPQEVETKPVDDDLVRQPMGLLPQKEERSSKRAMHRGAGRWFVMSGEEIVSGPHDKSEATRLAALPDEVVEHT